MQQAPHSPGRAGVWVSPWLHWMPRLPQKTTFVATTPRSCDPHCCHGLASTSIWLSWERGNGRQVFRCKNGAVSWGFWTCSSISVGICNASLVGLEKEEKPLFTDFLARSQLPILGRKASDALHSLWVLSVLLHALNTLMVVWMVKATRWPPTQRESKPVGGTCPICCLRPKASKSVAALAVALQKESAGWRF